MAEHKIERRVAGYHDIRMDGMTDLVIRARGASVLDVGCNRGLVGFEMANNGAKVVHGCDHYDVGIQTARELFADLRSVQSRFEVVDLTQGAKSLSVFGDMRYDIVLMLATYHKLKRVNQGALDELVRDLAARTIRFFAWRGTSTEHGKNRKEMKALDDTLLPLGLERVHTSALSRELGMCAVWARI